MSLYSKVFKPKTIQLENGKTVDEPKSPVLLISIILMVLTYFALDLTGFNFRTLIERGHQFFVLLEGMFFASGAPNFNFWRAVWTPLIDTVKMSLLGTILGAGLALPVAIIASTNIIKNQFVIVVSRFIFSFVRTIPTIVIALIAMLVLGIGTTAGTVAITLFTFGFVGKLLYEQIETVDMGAYEAMKAMGANRTQAVIVAIMPQIMPRFLSNSLFCFEGNVRHAAILGMVGAGGIGIILNTNLAFRSYANVGMIILMLFITVFIIEMIARFVRSKLV